MIIEEYNETKTTILRTTWKFENSDQEYLTSWTVCENPFCTCTEMTFGISIGLNDTPMASFAIDIHSEKIIKIGSYDSSKLLSEKLVSELSKNDKKILYEIFRTEKELITDKVNIEGVEPPIFPEYEIENESLLISFKQIFPWSKVHWFALNEKIYHLIDYYCLNSLCNCKDANIDFLCFINEQHINVNKETLISYDLNSGKWNTIQKSELTHSTPLLIENMLLKYPNIRQTFNKRRTILISLYKKYKEVRGIEKIKGTHSSAISIGRNEPCPCGSGKKYKKCCGRN